MVHGFQFLLVISIGIGVLFLRSWSSIWLMIIGVSAIDAVIARWRGIVTARMLEGQDAVVNAREIVTMRSKFVPISTFLFDIFCQAVVIFLCRRYLA